MSQNTNEVSHLIFTVPVERDEYTIAIEDIVYKFFGKHSKIVRNKSLVSIHIIGIRVNFRFDFL